jgi:hypothetical protein
MTVSRLVVMLGSTDFSISSLISHNIHVELAIALLGGTLEGRGQLFPINPPYSPYHSIVHILLGFLGGHAQQRRFPHQIR